jgi:hypothetical protein
MPANFHHFVASKMRSTSKEIHTLSRIYSEFDLKISINTCAYAPNIKLSIFSKLLQTLSTVFGEKVEGAFLFGSLTKHC